MKEIWKKEDIENGKETGGAEQKVKHRKDESIKWDSLIRKKERKAERRRKRKYCKPERIVMISKEFGTKEKKIREKFGKKGYRRRKGSRRSRTEG